MKQVKIDKTEFFRFYKIANLMVAIIFMFRSQSSFAQEIPKDVMLIIEKNFASDTANKLNMDLLKNRTFHYWKIQNVVYKSLPTTIYEYGGGSEHTGHNYLLFKNDNSEEYVVVGCEMELIISLKQLRKVLDKTDSISAETVKYCYSLMLDNHYWHNCQ